MDLKCDSLQGFYFSHPEPEAGLEMAILRTLHAFELIHKLRVKP
ncbi:hypothetical protein ACW0JT_23240 [Arthrobacter sp. SA17]